MSFSTKISSIKKWDKKMNISLKTVKFSRNSNEKWDGSKKILWSNKLNNIFFLFEKKKNKDDIIKRNLCSFRYLFDSIKNNQVKIFSQDAAVTLELRLKIDQNLSLSQLKQIKT